MSVVDRIKKFLDDTEKIPLKDASGKIITPEGAEADISAQAIRRCLQIAREEENNVS